MRIETRGRRRRALPSDDESADLVPGDEPVSDTPAWSVGEFHEIEVLGNGSGIESREPEKKNANGGESMLVEFSRPPDAPDWKCVYLQKTEDIAQEGIDVLGIVRLIGLWDHGPIGSRLDV